MGHTVKLYARMPSPRERKLYDMVIGRGVEQEVGALLYGLVRVLKPNVCVETGTLVGDSAEWIGRALRDNGFGHLTTCDIDPARIEPASKRLQGLPVSIIQKPGIETLGSFEMMDFVHIDSGDLECRINEVMSLDERNISPGGIVCWHDAIVGFDSMYESFANARNWPHLLIPSVVGLAVFARPE
jgi:predicted O-methyltransferase YrrM